MLRPNDVSPNLIRRGAFAQRSGRARGPTVGAPYLRDGDVVAQEFTGVTGGGAVYGLGVIWGVGGFDLESACAVAGSDDVDEYATLNLIDVPVRKSLLVAHRPCSDGDGASWAQGLSE